ncbi:hypothetical protein KFK09_006332 [Dendrobium nobile]|uniref:Uncharacterized protein n=1 Tax=Dendrobium nobile TaxID=94219 RepID=A0A8T3BNS1_DENNO|nr:hypothetical protein KFK09_006332 [Dendrobium nobile]
MYRIHSFLKGGVYIPHYSSIQDRWFYHLYCSFSLFFLLRLFVFRYRSSSSSSYRNKLPSPITQAPKNSGTVLLHVYTRRNKSRQNIKFSNTKSYCYYTLDTMYIFDD